MGNQSEQFGVACLFPNWRRSARLESRPIGPSARFTVFGGRLNRQWGNTVASFGKQVTRLAERQCEGLRIPPSRRDSLASSIW